MYYKQGGFLPLVSKFLGVFLATFLVLGIARYVPGFYAENFANYPDPNSIQNYLRMIYFFVVLSLLPIITGSLFWSMFPQIRISEHGVEYKYLFFLRGRILWDEIEKIVVYSNGYAALMISRRGMNLLNGLYFNRLHGRLVRLPRPVLFISNQIENRAELLEQISQRSSALVVKR